MSVKNRLKEFIKYTGITVQSFEKSINASNGYVNGMVKGIGEDKILMILEVYPNLNFDWLMTGRGEMIRVEKNENKFIAQEDELGYSASEEYWKGRYDQIREDYEKLLKELGKHLK